MQNLDLPHIALYMDTICWNNLDTSPFYIVFSHQCDCGLVAPGKSNSGEGGEDPVRWLKLDDIDGDGTSKALPHLKGLQEGDTATSRIKQVRRCCSNVCLTLVWISSGSTCDRPRRVADSTGNAGPTRRPYVLMA